MITSATTTAQLVSFYNLNVAADKQIKKFADRKTAERRCAEIIARLGADAAETLRAAKVDSYVTGFSDHGFSHCPHCSIHLSNGVSVDGDGVNGKPLRHDMHLYECLGCGEGFGALLRRAASSATRSDAIAASWKDPKVAAARAERTCVRVFNVKTLVGDFTSTADAFRRLGLPLAKHIPFRMALKAAGSNKFGPYKFIAVAA
jgi:hypothetical protein